MFLTFFRTFSFLEKKMESSNDENVTMVIDSENAPKKVIKTVRNDITWR